jgi:hypothetical protein
VTWDRSYLPQRGVTAGGCSDAQNKTFGCVPAGCQDTVQTLARPIGAVAPACAPAGAGSAPPDAVVQAALAVRPYGGPDAGWVPKSKTATVPRGERRAGRLS